jgi:hypothetical protein
MSFEKSRQDVQPAFLLEFLIAGLEPMIASI